MLWIALRKEGERGNVLRTRPSLTYKGLTVVLSHPSRFDTVSLLSATGGHLLNEHCLRPEMNIMQCDVRLASDTSPLLDGTKCILLLGEVAMHTYLPQTKNNTIGEMRGSPFKTVSGILAIPSFFPQDAVDFKNLEARLNPLSADYSPDVEDDTDDEDDYDAVKRHGKTKRGNYAFWLRADVKKCIAIIKNDGKIPFAGHELVSPNYRIFPPSDEVIRLLTTTKNQTMFFDIETDYEEQNLQCFAFSFDGVTVYSVPVLDYNYKPAYGNLHLLIRALSVAIRDNLLVAHNGAAFDFLVLGYKYHIPVYRCYDTLLAMHRCFPDIEKSLGHCTSYWTWQVFHKDEDSKGYITHQQMMARLSYCGKDVFTLALIYYAIEQYASTVTGLRHSIDTVMACIRPYLITTLQGIKVDTQKVKDAAQENDRLMMQYNRIAMLLVGDKALAEIRSHIKGKVSMFCGSNTQCVRYFHDMLDYAVVARSAKTKAPSLGKKAMYKLALKYPENPVIQLVLAYRKIAKEYGTYKFVPWLDDEGKRGDKSILEYGNQNTAQPRDTNQTTIQV